MAARFRKIDPRMWHDEAFTSLTRDEKLIAVYCISSSQCNRLGIYHLSPGLAAEQIGLKPEGYAKGIARVCDTLNWRFDHRVNVLYLPTWWKYNGGIGYKTMRGHLEDLHDLPQTPLVQDFLGNSRYLSPEEAAELDTHAKGMPGVSPQEQEQEQEKEQEQEQEQEQENDQEQEKESKPSSGKPDRSTSTYSDEFKAWWAAYPRQVAKGRAWKEYQAAVKRVRSEHGMPAAEAHQHLLEAAQAFSKTPKGKAGKFCPHPATWLSGACYDDDPATWQDGGTFDPDGLTEMQRRGIANSQKWLDESSQEGIGE